jgi:hypothetical protein
VPYNRETAGKGGHSDFVKNPDVQQFLDACNYMRQPSDEEGQLIASEFIDAPSGEPDLPNFVVASDASKSDNSINDKLPSTQIGFIKVSHVLIAMNKYAELIDPSSRFVDPFKAADLHRNAQSITYVLPGSNVLYKNTKNVKDGFRNAVYDQMNLNRRDGNNPMVLTETLLELNNNAIEIPGCPSCGATTSNLIYTRNTHIHNCPSCNSALYVTDWLRLHEGISDFGNNTSAMTRMMNAVEHLLISAFILEMLNDNPKALSNVAFVIDGPLALFGEPAKLHKCLMNLIHKANRKLHSLSCEPLLFIGLQKTGAVMDHANLIKPFLSNGKLRVIDDEYRDKYITGSESISGNFGNETYYGQDFLFKTESGRIFNFALPYPMQDKSQINGISFSKAKIDLKRYGSSIKRACDLIQHFELDLYDNAIVPVALAHRHASISITPGSTVLDLLAKEGLNK